MAFSTGSETSRFDQPSVSSPARKQPPSRPFVCTACHSSFRRVDHLQRHAQLHTRGKHYQCPCGETFSRNDVLAQHLRRCDKARSQQTTKAAPQTRSKRACDRCAKSKMKCNNQNPCDRCTAKSIACEFTRPGYEDPYKQYGIRTGPNENISEDKSEEPPSSGTETASLRRPGSKAQNSGAVPAQPVLGDVDLFFQQEPRNTKGHDDFGDSEFLNLDYLPMEFDFWPMWDWNVGQGIQQQQHDLPDASDAMNDGMDAFDKCTTETRNLAVSGNAPLSLTNGYPPNTSHGYSIEQIDPIEVKCAAVRSLLQDSEPLVTKDMVLANITREKLLLCIQLFGKHFQRNYPILHSPTFSLVDTSPILLLAMMLTGACYSDGLISNAHITKFSMSLLILIEKLPHEIDMQIPSLSTIQASIIICGILVCSRNEIASRFVSVHFARNISMADRAGVFDEVSPLSYSMMTEDMFDWQQWVEQESRKRIACEILSQDMAACVFQGKSPSLSPLTLKVELPCYEVCWEAQTPSLCFHLLQKFPPQMQVSGASRRLRMISLSVENVPLFEASAFGMSTLIMGLHGFLFQTMEEDMDPGLGAASLPFSHQSPAAASSDDTDQLDDLKQDLSGVSIARYADCAVARHGSFAISRANAVLNAWHSTWENRNVRDYEHENITFKGDPLRFWWLAKLLLVVHVQGRAISNNSELAIPSPSTGDMKGKIELQTKLVKWLARFRRQGSEVDLPDEVNVLSTLMKSR